jgi:predicted glycoside hydrolase/deacetylase ChbG (UPF0249 family)
MNWGSAHPARSEGLRTWVVCADDFAQSEPVTDGICRLATQGHITATSAMTLSPRWPSDAARLADVPAPLDVGLHLDWSSPFAVQAGHGLSLPAVMLRSALRCLRPEAVRVAVERQLDAFEAVWKAPPDHVDGHQHVHQMPVIRQALLQVLKRRYPAQAPWVRVSAPAAGLADAKSRIVAAWGAAPWARLAQAQGLVVRPWLVGVYGFDPRPGVYEGLLAHWAQVAPTGSVLMCHPASALDATDPIGAARLQEFRCFSRSDLLDAWARAGIRAVRGRECMAEGAASLTA